MKVLEELGISRNNLVEKKSIEVGNIFNLGTKFFGTTRIALYKRKKERKSSVVMGCYGLGPSRTMEL